MIKDAPARVPMKVMPMIAMIKSSGEPNSSTSGRIIGIDKANDRAPMTEPKTEAVIAAPKARPASPFFVMG